MVNIGILALQGDVAEHVRALEESGARAVLVRRSEELASVDGLVIPGGESTTMSNLLLSFGIFDQLAEQISNGMPVYGTCAGMIMLATSILALIWRHRHGCAPECFWPSGRLLRRRA